MPAFKSTRGGGGERGVGRQEHQFRAGVHRPSTSKGGAYLKQAGSTSAAKLARRAARAAASARDAGEGAG